MTDEELEMYGILRLVSNDIRGKRDTCLKLSGWIIEEVERVVNKNKTRAHAKERSITTERE